MIHEESKLKGSKKLMKNREIIKLTMKEKLRDNRISEGRIRKLRNRELGTIEKNLGKNSRPCRRLRSEVREHCQKLRGEVRSKMEKKEELLVKNYSDSKAMTL